MVSRGVKELQIQTGGANWQQISKTVSKVDVWRPFGTWLATFGQIESQGGQKLHKTFQQDLETKCKFVMQASSWKLNRDYCISCQNWEVPKKHQIDTMTVAIGAGRAMPCHLSSLRQPDLEPKERESCKVARPRFCIFCIRGPRGDAAVELH